jgi:response regulator RpfG family c-di-GMP phosphodiesterase
MNSNQTNQTKSSFRILACHPDTGTLRLIRESITNLLNVDIDTSPSSEYAFELAVKRPYSLLMFGINMPNLSGPLLYDMLCMIHSKVHQNEPQYPPVIFIGDENDSSKNDDLRKDARVKDLIYRPLSIDRIINATQQAITLRE